MRALRTLLPALAVLLLPAFAGCAAPGGTAGASDGPGDGEEGLNAEAGVLSGRLTAVGSSTSQPMTVTAAGHQRLSVVLVLASNLPQSSIGLNVTGPDGRTDEVRTGPTLYVLPGGRPGVSFSAPTPGDWTARVELRNGAAADYEVHWCADDAAAPGPQDNLACQRDVGA